MIGLRPSLGLVALLTALAVPAPAAMPPSVAAALVPAQDLKALFDEGVALMRAGRDEEALAVFRRVVASDPGSDEAYRLMERTENQAWLDLLIRQGEFEQVARHFMGVSRSRLAERRNDPAAIRDLLTRMQSANAVERRTIVQTLASQHGEYAVPLMLAALADRANQERRVLTMQALTRFGSDAVPPLLEALESPDAYLRQNIAFALGHIGDRRAAGVLLHLAANDPEGSVRAAADHALGAMQIRREDAAAVLTQQGRDYLARRDNVLPPGTRGEVVWHFDGTRLVPHPVARLIYAEEMAKQTFYRALAADPGHLPALAGIAHASAAAVTRLEEIADLSDDFELPELVHQATLAALAAGPAALDAALAAALADRDEGGSYAIVRLMARSLRARTPALEAAVHTDSAIVAEEAALAIAGLGLADAGGLAQDVVQRLARAAGRQVLQGALVIDADGRRVETLTAALRSRGMLVQHAASGARGLAMILRLPPLDAVFVAERLPDLTASQVLTEIEHNAAQARAPRFLLAQDADAAEELFGERVAGVIDGDLDLAALDTAIDERAGRDRALADDLSARAARKLAELSRTGIDVSVARQSLLGTLEGRPDTVTVPALEVLGKLATPDDLRSLLGVAADDVRSEASRVAAGDALAGLFARHRQSADAAALTTLGELVRSDETPLEVRRSLANALGQLDLDPGVRAALLRDVRVSLGSPASN